jgi:molybdate transport system substrate-binding protein
MIPLRRSEKRSAGEEFDVTVITSEAIGDLIKQGTLAGASRAELARSELGIGIRAGATKPDIHSPEALKRALLDAKSITYPQDGASRGYIEKMFERMGIAAALTPKIILAGIRAGYGERRGRKGGICNHAVQ